MAKIAMPVPPVRKPGVSFVVSLAAALLMTGVGMIVALLPQRVFALTGSLESVGLIASVFAISYLLAQLPVGLLADRYGAKPFLVAGYALCGVAGLVFFWSGSAGAVYLGRLIQGAGEAPVWALGPALLSLAHPEAKGRVIGAYNAAIHAGLTVGPLIGLWASAAGDGAAFLAFAALAFAGGGAVWLLLPNMRPRRTASVAADGAGRLSRLLTRRRPMLALSGVLLFGAGYGLAITVLPVSLGLSKGFDAQATSLLFVVFYAAIGLAQLLVGPLSDRLGRGGFMVGGMLAAAAGLAAWPLPPGAWTLAPIGLASLGLGAFSVAALVELNESASDEAKGAVSGASYLAWSMGYFLGPLVVSRLEAASPMLGYGLLAAALGLYALALWATPARRR